MTKNKYDYSVIIPHKNIPELLERCLSSIPLRDYIQVIVVDDNSDPTIVDFARFPGINRQDTEVIFHKAPVGQGGSGVARNVGIAEAKGRWLVFADADDFFHSVAGEMFDKYREATAGIVFFRHDSVDSETMEPVKINTSRNRKLEHFEVDRNEDPLRYMIWVPWGKFISRSMVMRHGITFDEVRFSNNLMFSVMTGHHAAWIISDPSVLYCNVRREGSLVHEGRSDWEAMSQRFDVDYRAAKFIMEEGKGKLFDGVVADRWKDLSRIDRRKARKLLPRLCEVCSPGQIHRVRFEMAMERAVRPFEDFFGRRKRRARHETA